MARAQETITCPVCGRGYPAKFWVHVFPKPWRLGVRQDPGQRWKVVGEISDPAELDDRGVFGEVRGWLLEAVAHWVFKNWLDIRELLERVADLRRLAGRLVWHQRIRIPRTIHRVDHGYGWGRAPEVKGARVEHSFKFGG